MCISKSTDLDVLTHGMVHECAMLLLPEHIHEPLQDVLGPSPATDPLLASLERALMEDPVRAEVKRDNAQGVATIVDDQQHQGEGELFPLLSCTSVA